MSARASVVLGGRGPTVWPTAVCGAKEGTGRASRREEWAFTGVSEAAMSPAPRSPVLAAWGAGVDSTAMLIELIARGEPVDQVLFADVGAEKAETLAFVPVFRAWLADHGVASEVVRYAPKNFKNLPPYRTLTENLLTNGALPGIAFGRGACSQKWKAAPQHAWAKGWPPAQAARGPAKGGEAHRV